MNAMGSNPITKALPQKKRRRWGRIAGAASLIVVLLLGAASGFAYWMLNRSLPQVKGKLELAGLQQPVSVWRDENGVPHIEAANEHDLYLAQGFITAQDRMFQMDLSRRQASGQLSEVVGEKALDRDKFFRAFGLRRAAEASMKIYSPEAIKSLEAYAQGVNSYIRQAKESGTLPVEFTILGYEPTDWQPLDSLTIGKYMAYDLGGHWQGQAFRYQLTQKVSQEMALDLFPSYPQGGATIIQALKDNPLDLKDLFAAAEVPNPFNGSNNWVVSGQKSASGKPMLANDPHLGLATPSIWYETHLKTPDMGVSGVIFAGVPGIILGHNDQIAWGVTNLGPDVQDLYIEKRNPNNPNEFEYMGKWEPATIHHEEIKVKDKASVNYDVAVTRHGPIITEFTKDDKPQPNTALSLKWTAHEATTELEAVQRFAKARNWDQFKEALTYFQAPAQNFVFASADGTIAYRGNGKIPIRKGNAIVPVPGWTDEYEWKGYIPWDQLPTTVNPPKGYIATANNKVVGDSYPFHLSNSWAQPYREARIQQVLESKPVLTADDLKNLQFDHYNLHAEEFLAKLLAKLEKNDSLRQVDKEAAELLKSWNKVDDEKLGAPLIYALWLKQMENVIFKPEITDDMMKLFEDKSIVRDELMRKGLAGKADPWIDGKGGMEKVALQSFQLAVDEAVSLQGKKPSKWQWGTYHKIDFAHPLGAVAPLDLVFNAKAVPMGGSKVTVGVGGWDQATGMVNHGGAWRSVTDMANPKSSFNVVGPGQSGQLLSPWYHDQVDEWTTGKYHVTSMEPSAYQAAGNHLQLVPATGGK